MIWDLVFCFGMICVLSVGYILYENLFGWRFGKVK